jgi:hypothetical protein
MEIINNFKTEKEAPKDRDEKKFLANTNGLEALKSKK